ncbi:MAG: cation:proton antiporter [Bdellovibrionota bacterium]
MVTHLPALIQDLALILVAAGFVTVLFRRIGQPVVLGYILAGLLVGPNIHWFPTVADLPNVKIWAEIGVIFLLFALGLEFSFKKLAKVGGSSTITASVEVIGMVLIGYATGKAFGWPTMDCLFLGGILAISSTTIIIRAFEEAGVKGQGFANLVFGILIVEDLFAVVLLVILSTLAATNQVNGTELISSVAKLIFFIIILFLGGIFFLPTWLRRMKPYANDETLLIVSLGLCFFMVVLTTKVGFSPALGAFVMGSILAETNEVHKIERLINPVKDLFGAIFFVSVGMLIEPQVLIDYAIPILVITVVTVVGKILTTVIGALTAGQDLKKSIHAGLSLAQIGEFSFIIASLGLTLNVTSSYLYPIAVGISALTTFFTPYLIKYADPISNYVEAKLPATMRANIEQYSHSTRNVSGSVTWKTALKNFVLFFLFNTIVITGIFLLFAEFAPPFIGRYFVEDKTAAAVSLIIALIVSAPFFWALLIRRPRRDELRTMWNNKDNRAVVVGLEILRILLVFIIFGILSSQFIELRVAFAITIFVFIAFIFVVSRKLGGIYSWIEKRFLDNLSDRNLESDS